MNLSPNALDGPLRVGRSKKKRNSLEIISEMLEAAEHGSRKTSIMYKANLSYDLLVQYLAVLRENEFLETSDDRMFFPTRKGSKFLKEFREFRDLYESYEQKAQVIRKLFER